MEVGGADYQTAPLITPSRAEIAYGEDRMINPAIGNRACAAIRIARGAVGRTRKAPIVSS